MTDRLSAVRATLGDRGLLVTAPPQIRWLSGFTGSNGLIYIDATQAILITDGRYTEQAKQQAPGLDLVIKRRSHHALIDLSSRLAPAILYDPNTVTVAELNLLKEALAGRSLDPAPNVFSPLMAVKSPEEINLLQRAQNITDQVFTDVLGIIKPGMSEKHIAAEIAYRQIRAGADGIPEDFWPIVASGPNSALPHAEAGDRILEQGDVVLLDFGCTVGGYASDMSRTVVLGTASDKICVAYNTVLQAQKAAIAAAKAGITGHELDAVARAIINKAGYDMPHGLGHGVGLELHEWPRLGKDADYKLPAQAVVTIEPGIYLPGKFGIRIEDMAALEEDGCRNLTESAKELIIVPV